MAMIRDLILRSPNRLAIPVLSYPAARLTGHTVRDLVTDPAAQVAVQEALRERYGVACVLTPMDLSVEGGEFGASIMMTEHEIPSVTGRLVTDEAEIEQLPVPRVGAGRSAVYLEAVRRLAALPGRPPVLAGMIGPFSLAARLFGVGEALAETIERPAMLQALIAKAAAFLTAYAEAFKQAGAAGVIVAEPTAGLISPRAAAEFSSAPLHRLIAAVATGQFEVILHNCGARLAHLPATLEAGASVCHFGRPMDLGAALSRVPAGIVLGGNLDPAEVFVQATPDGVRARTTALLAAAQGRREFFISSGCDVPPDAPLANIDAFFAAVRDFDGAG
jgi:uroporphyrinogen decarboxylase